MKKPTEPTTTTTKGVSIREFARQMGVSDVAVAKAIRTGKITEGIDYTNPKRPKVDPELAAKSWGRNFNPIDGRTNPAFAEKLEKIAIEEEAAPPPKQNASFVDVEPAVSTNSSIAKIKQQHEMVKLQSAALDLKIKKGEYVRKSEVYRELFAAGQELRVQFQAIPDKCIDDLLAAGTRGEALRILQAHIADALEMLDKTTDKL
jgi:hypothetical protein